MEIPCHNAESFRIYLTKLYFIPVKADNYAATNKAVTT